MKFRPRGPKFTLHVPCNADAVCLEVSWVISDDDASCWDRPLSIAISPVTSEPTDETWETVVDLSRDDARLLRDAIDLMLRSPDIRQNADGSWITQKPDLRE